MHLFEGAVLRSSDDCMDKDEKFCASYLWSYGDRVCLQDWFINKNGLYGCVKSCDLCPDAFILNMIFHDELRI